MICVEIFCYAIIRVILRTYFYPLPFINIIPFKINDSLYHCGYLGSNITFQFQFYYVSVNVKVNDDSFETPQKFYPVRIYWQFVLQISTYAQNLKIVQIRQFLKYHQQYVRSSLLAQRVKNLPAMQETWVQSLGQEDPLEKAMATHSSILAWRSPWRGEPGGLQSMGSQRVRYD